MERENAWKKYPEGKKREPVLKFGEDYRQFLSDCKTERECVEFFEAQAKAAGYIPLQEAIEKKQALKQVSAFQIFPSDFLSVIKLIQRFLQWLWKTALTVPL